MTEYQRPSGATIRVVKSFPTEKERDLHLWLMAQAGPRVALGAVGESPVEISMPLATPRVSSRALVDLLTTYKRLWSTANPRTPVSRKEYRNYVLERYRDTSRFSSASADGLPILQQAAQREQELYFGGSEPVGDMPLRGSVFTHGDAIVSNAVGTPAGVRLIDFSPRPTPSEIEIDFSKLLFSAIGFDLGPRRGTILRELLCRLTAELDLNDRLVQYYLATHIIRVITREPPRTLARVKFFTEALRHV